jgi:hypothetical protein
MAKCEEDAAATNPDPTVAMLLRELAAKNRQFVKSADWREKCNKGHVHLGMTSEEAKAEWCVPYTINRTRTAAGVKEQWVYRSIHGGAYLYFEDGILVAIQD